MIPPHNNRLVHTQNRHEGMYHRFILYHITRELPIVLAIMNEQNFNPIFDNVVENSENLCTNKQKLETKGLLLVCERGAFGTLAALPPFFMQGGQHNPSVF